MAQKFTLIGIDGGATKVNGWILNLDDNLKNFSLSDLNAERKYSELKGFISDFTPVPLPIQIDEMESNEFNLTDNEKQQGNVYTQACSDVIESLANKSEDNPIIVGIGMPGLKTEDKRGLSAVANGPRIPDYGEKVEQSLKEKGIEFLSPITHLGSDADYCGIGENYGNDGGFKDVYNAYYLGGGTGAADALKLRGELIAMDKTKSWLAKTWEMKNEIDISMEKYASASGIQYIYSNICGISTEELNQNNIFSPQIAEKAMVGDNKAIETYQEISKYLALLFYERITSLYCGSQNLFKFVNPNRNSLSTKHFYREDTFERIVIGQRLSDLMGSKAGNEVLTKPLAKSLSNLINNSECLPESVKSYYLHNSKLKNERLFLSKLREAPAMGAGIDAYFSFTKNKK
jgi:predicted NBD/HSP70 family sugar kinase